MIFVRYDRNRLILAALAMLGLAYASSAGAGASGDLIADTIATVMFVVFVCAASRLGYLASGDMAALKDDGDALIVTGLWRARRVPWRGFAGVAIRGVRMLWLPLPFLSFDHLVVRRGDGGLLGGKAQVPLLLADFSRGRMAALSEQLDTLSLERGWGRPEEAAAASAQGGFDPDAAIARYIARKQEDEAPAAPAARPFARPAAALPRPAVSARAGFGRKGL